MSRRKVIEQGLPSDVNQYEYKFFFLFYHLQYFIIDMKDGGVNPFLEMNVMISNFDISLKHHNNSTHYKSQKGR